jgi:transmembrane sensor
LTAREADKRLAWTRGLLILDGEALGQVIGEINRYHKRKIVMADPALKNMQV